jgi:hypothetical protein
MRVSHIKLGQEFVLEQAARLKILLTLQRIASSLHRKKEIPNET